MQNTITLPKTEYRRLKKIAERYEVMRHLRGGYGTQRQSPKEVIRELRATGLYKESFLKHLEKSLKEAQEGRIYPLESLRDARKA